MPKEVKTVMAAERQTADEIYSIVRSAIIDKNIVSASYRDYIREMCPHVIGKKNRHPRALLYQFAGGSRSGLELDGSPANWRCLRIDELSDVSIKQSAGEWHTASNYSIRQTCVDDIEVKVDVR